MSILAAFTLAVISVSADSQAAAPRPNFVFIVADDMACDDCGAYGHPRIRTPQLDRLAKEGLRFDAAFLTCSSCSPSRASILTGRYPHATGAAELHMPLPADRILLSELLRKAGYYTAVIGKWHLGPAAVSKFDLVKQGGGPGGHGDWVESLRARPKSKPFFLWLAATDPHRPYTRNISGKPHAQSDAVVPPYLPDVPEVRADLADYYDEIARLDGRLGEVLAELAAQKLVRDTLVAFLSDNGRPFPRCKTTVFDSGVRTPLIIRYPRLVKAGGVSTSLVSSIDLFPTVLELAGLPPAPTAQGTTLVPVLRNPTAEVRRFAFAEHNWHDFRAYERGVRSSRYLYILNEAADVPRTPPADAVRSPTFAAMRKLRDERKLAPTQMGTFVKPQREELYDCQTDPHQLTDIADRPQHREALDELRAALAAWRKGTADVLPTTLTPDKYDRETGVTPKKP